MATQIGIITTLIGTATATATDGSIRNLQVGDQVFADELISTGAGSAVEITFEDGSVMDLGRNSQAVLDSEAYDPTVVQDVAESTASDVEALQQALLEGADPTQLPGAEATAAGAGAETTDGNEGTAPVYVDYLAPEVTPDSGFETTGIGVEFPVVEEELQAPEEEVILPEVEVSVTVDVEIGNPIPGDNQDDVILIPGGTVIPIGVTSLGIPEGPPSDGGSHPVTFLITLSEASTEPVSLHFKVNTGTADNPEDYFDGTLEGDVTIPAGYIGFTVTVNLREDALPEANENFFIVISDVVGATVVNDTAMVTIIDDDVTLLPDDVALPAG